MEMAFRRKFLKDKPLNFNISILKLSNENFIKFYNSLKQEKEILEL